MTYYITNCCHTAKITAPSQNIALLLFHSLFPYNGYTGIIDHQPEYSRITDIIEYTVVPANE